MTGYNIAISLTRKEAKTMKDMDVYKDKLKSIIKDLSDKRDELRTLHDEIEEILESFDDGIEGAQDAISELERAIDKMSEYV